MKIGDYKLIPIQTGLLKLDGGAMFGIVPKTLWSKTNPADEKNRIEMCSRSLLLDNGKERILIDTGTGQKLPSKLKDIYAVDNNEYTPEKSLATAGYSTDDITTVLLTHLHFDHAGGNTFLNEEGKPQITFKNAEYLLQSKHFEWANNPTDRDRASFFPDDFIPLAEQGRLKLIEGDYKINDVISLHPVNGHTRNMSVVKISDGDETLIYLADLIAMSSQLHLPFIMGYDLFPVVTLEEKRKYLSDAVKGNWSLFFEHDPYTECVKPGFYKDKYFIKEKFTL